MKKSLLILILLIEIVIVNAQPTSNNLNYIRTTTVTVEGKTEPAQAENAPIGHRIVSYTYFDGLGRPIQNVTQQGSPLQKDIVQPIFYDALGREAIKYLPYVDAMGTDGFFKTNALRLPASSGTEEQQYQTGKQFEFYQSGGLVVIDQYPYAKTIFEPSPLSRTVEGGAPGLPWQPDAINTYSSTDRTIKNAYESNTTDEVLLWTYSYPTPAYPLGLVSATSIATPTIPNYYEPNQLYRSKTKDEEGHEVIEYTDKVGRTVLKRVQAVAGTPTVNDANYASTYYIYDDFGNLVCVIPPAATNNLPSTSYQTDDDFLKLWAFRYSYDERRRMKLKQVPGAEPVYMVYDDRDRLVLTQDGVQRLQNKWTFTKYDALNRPIVTGIHTHGSSLNQQEMSGQINTTNFFETYVGAASPHGYTDGIFPQNGTILTVTYYDTYSFRDDLIGGSTFNFKQDDISGQETSSLPTAIGKVTGTKVNVLNTSDYLWGVTYYDSKYRVIQNIASNYRGGSDLTTSIIDFSGKVLNTKTTTREPGESDIAVHHRFEYDHAGRLTETWHRINGEKEILLSMTAYNELGQLVAKGLHKEAVVADPLVGQPGVVYNADIVLSQYDPAVTTYIATNSITLQPGFSVPTGSTFIARMGYSQQDADAHNALMPFAQEIDFRYTINGWLDNINDVDAPNTDDLFSLDLNYNNPVADGGPAQYNGNISQAQWKGADGEKKSYGYYYDPMNRLKEGRFFNVTVSAKNGRFTEKIGDGSTAPAYDLNGNILNLFRNGKTGEDASSGIVTYGLMDDLAYSYTAGNQLSKVTDDEIDTEGFKEGSNTDDDYAYDVNGNMHMDKNKNLNSNSITYNYLNLPQRVERSPTEYVQYVYDATGRKLRQIVVEGGVTKSTDYGGEFIYENDALQFINHEEGRAVMTGSSPEYQYHLKDHLGNVRTTFTTIEETEAPVATLETAKETEDRANFLKYDDIRKVNYALFDHTNTGATKYAMRLTGTAEETYGLARSISVMPGDKITAKVFAKYLDLTQPDINQAVLNFINAIPTATGGTVIDGAAYGTPGAATIPFDYRVDKSGEQGGVPKAYLNWLVFDKDYNPIESISGYDRVTVLAKENGQSGIEGVGHEQLISPEINITEAGYLYIYLSNEEEGYEVYFDDFTVEQVMSPVVQSDDYYPFGLAFNSYKRESGLKQKFKFQGQEHIDDLDLGWDSFKWRNHQPDIGRFFNVDPLAEKYAYNSPYAFSENDVISAVELEGLEKQRITNYSQIQSQKISENLKAKTQVLETPITASNSRSSKVAEVDKRNDEVMRIVEHGSKNGFTDDYMTNKLEESGIEVPGAVKAGASTTTIETIDPEAKFSTELFGVVNNKEGNLEMVRLGEINYSKEAKTIDIELGKAFFKNTLEAIIEFLLFRDSPVEIPPIETPTEEQKPTN